MKKALIAWAVFLLPVIVMAQTPSRDALIEKIQNAYFQVALFSPDSPIIDLYLQRPKDANREASPETWVAVKKDLALALTHLALQKGGALDKTFRKSLESLNDAEIAKLSEMVSDPVFAKFQKAMASPDTQRVMLMSAATDTLKMGYAVNIVLAKHGLREVH